MVKTRSLFIPILFCLAGSASLYSQNQKIDGYKGLWFSAGKSSGYGYIFSGGSATFGSQHRPVAIYSPEAKKTFFVYGGTTSYDERHLLIMISYFSHTNQTVPKPVVVYDKMGVREPFDNPSLAIDHQGYLWVFISGSERTRPGMIFRSTEPYSIDHFEEIMHKEMIAPQPWWINEHGLAVVFIRKITGPDIYFSSSRDGRTWSENQKIASMGGHVHVSHAKGNKLVIIFNYSPGGNPDKQTNLYYLQTEDMGKTWKTVDGRIVEIPLTDPINEALVRNFEAEGTLVYLSDVCFDQEGNPVLLVILSKSSEPGPEGGPREWMLIRWKDRKWNYSKVCESDHNYDVGALFITDDGWSVIGPSEPGRLKYRTGGEIVNWIGTDDGATWVKATDLTFNSQVNNSFVKRPVNYNRRFYALWTDGDADKLSPSHLYFTDQKCRKVWMLPYDMISDFVKPVRIR